MVKPFVVNLVRSLRGPTAVVIIPALLSVPIGLTLLLVAWPTIRPSCDLRYGTYTSNVEVTGWGAGGVCKQLQGQDPELSDSSADGPVVCDIPYQGHDFLVHDPAGGYVGTQLCGLLDFVIGASEGLPSQAQPSPGSWSARAPGA